MGVLEPSHRLGFLAEALAAVLVAALPLECLEGDLLADRVSGLEDNARATGSQHALDLKPGNARPFASGDLLSRQAHGLRRFGLRLRRAGPARGRLAREGAALAGQVAARHGGDLKGVSCQAV